MSLGELGLYLSLTVLGLAFILWIMALKLIRFRVTDPYLCGESSRDFKQIYVDLSRTFSRTFKEVYRVLTDYVTTGIWNDWFSFSLPYLLILIIVFIAIYLRG